MGTRKLNSIRNTYSGIVNKVVVLFGQFISRTIIVQILGAQYLGLNSILISVLHILNLTELGFSNAIVYCLYRPIAKNDTIRVCSILSFYRKIYKCVGIFILFIGLIISPFLEKIVKDNELFGNNLYFYYFLYLLNTALSYFLYAYKSSVFIASQRQDLISIIGALSLFFQYIFQIIALSCFNSFYLYICSAIVCTVFNNMYMQYMSKKIFPQYICKGTLDTNTIVKVRELVVGIMFQRVCQTLRNSFDSICLSLFTSLTIVAIYGNYYFFLTIIIAFTGVFTTAISSVVGNGVAIYDKDKNYTEMNKLIFGYSWLSGFCCISFICLANPLMIIWMGEEYMFPFHIIVLLALYGYSLSIGDIRAIYHSAAGLWYKGKSVWLYEAFLNLILNFLLGYLYGVCGIIIATILTVVFVNFVFGSKILFKNYFTDYNILNYYKSHLIYWGVTLIIGVITCFICSLVCISGWNGILLRIIICVFIPNLLYFIVYRKYRYFRYFKSEFEQLIKSFITRFR